MKTHFTRKNFITFGITFFAIIIILLSALGLDGSLNLLGKNNIFSLLGGALGLPVVNGSAVFYILLLCVLIYILLFVVSFIYEMRLAKYYTNKIFTKKWVGIYVATFFITLILCFGIGLVAQYPYDPTLMVNNLILLGEALLVGIIISLILSVFILAICMIVVNFKAVDQPFRFFGAKVKEQEEAEEEIEKEEEERLEEQGELAASFGEANFDEDPSLINGVGGQGGFGNGSPLAPGLSEKERVFPGLCSIDYINTAFNEIIFEDNVNLDELCTKFRNYLAKVEHLYFDIATIRAFISGLSASRLLILEGLSGTGKSSLARYFSSFISEDSYFEAVQATWRDRTSVLGFYNDFSKSYNETEFLKRLYDAGYKMNHLNFMVLDEVNISRVEYYFADFLSVLEYPKDKWKLKIMQLPYDFIAPDHLADGILNIPENTWFIATANKDDSTFTITDKVYDRAITINFDNKNDPFEVKEEVSKITLSYSKLTSLFESAQSNVDYCLSKDELSKFNKLIEFTYDTFDLTIGNRILRQIELFTPTYVACGGSKDDALDFIFSRKVVAKLEGRFEDYIKAGLLDLKALISKLYGKESFALTSHVIDKLLRKL